MSHNPYVINPKRGYLVTANNRQYSDRVFNDFGSVGINTGRDFRINELI